MENRINITFKRLLSANEKGLIPYVMAGDPDLKTTEDLIIEMEKGGADIIELGVPFSDPIAEGTTIQRASERSLRQGTSLKTVLSLVKRVRRRTDIPLILMTYYNLIYKYNEDIFIDDAVRCGVDGIILPDLPPEEGMRLIKRSGKKGLNAIFLVAPTSTKDRIRYITSYSRGFIYYVSLTGITGAELTDINDIGKKIKEIREYTKMPVSVGFGIATPEQAAIVSQWADGVIVGSAIVKRIEKMENRHDLINDVRGFIKRLKRGITGH
ncbi:MAG: tryptophan synthase subunit alpha [Nitrospirota bacterium]